MVAYLTKSDASEGFNQILDFLNGSSVKYALTVNPNIYVSCIKQFWTTVAVKKVNDVIRLQALVDKKKVVIMEAIIREALRLDDAEGVECLPNEEIFAELARMGYEKPSTKLTFYKAFFSSQWKFLIHAILQCLSAKRTSWNEFSSSMASVVICLSLGRKFNFSKYIFDSLVRNVDSPSKFYMCLRFLQLMIRKQVGDLSTHTTKYTFPALTQKVFANMRRVDKGFSGVDTPLFKGMLVEQQVVVEGDADKNDENVNAGDTAEGDVSAARGEVHTVAEEPSIPSPTPPTPSPQPSQDIPSTSQVQPTPPQSPQVHPPSPQPQPQPQQDAGIPMNLLQDLMDTYIALIRRVEHLEFDKVAQALEITKLKRRVKKMERRNKVRVLKLRRLQKVGTTQRVETSDETVMDDVSNQGRMIAEVDNDAKDVVLEDDKEVANRAKEVAKDAKVDESVDIQGRKVKSQAEIYKIDLDHANKVLSIQEDKTKPAEVQEVVDVVTTAKLITKVVTAASETITAASTNITAAEAQVPAVTLTAALARVDGKTAESLVEIYKIDLDHANKDLSMQEDETEPDEVQEVVDVVTTAKLITEVVTATSETITAASTNITTAEAQVPVVTLTVAPARVTAAPSRKRKGVVIRDPQEESTTSPIIPAETKSKDKGKRILKYGYLLKTKEQIKEEESRALKRINKTPAKRAAKRQKLDEEVEELKRHLQIVPNKDGDVYTEATLLARKVLYSCSNLEESKKCTLSSKGQGLEVVGIMWCADHNIYNHIADFVSREEIPTHKIHSGSDVECVRLEVEEESKRRLNPKVQDVVEDEIVKLLDSGLIYPISDSPRVSSIYIVPKKRGMTVVLNDNNELIPSCTVTGWRVCIEEYYCFLDGFSGFFQIPIAPEDQEKTTFTCPYGTFSYKRMPFRLCNTPATFQRCMTAIFHDMVEDFMEVFMDDFLIFAEEEIADKFPNEHLMILKSKLNDEESWYADYVNYIVEKVIPRKWTPERKNQFFSQKQLTPEQIFWSNDLIKLKSKAPKEKTTVCRRIKALTVYIPNTPATLVPKVLSTKSQVKIYIFTLIQLFSEFDKTCKKKITPTGLTEGERGFEQTKECYLKEVIPFFKTLKDKFEGIQKALTKEIKEMKDVFEELEAEVAQSVFVATNSELNVARFTEMTVAHTTVEARCLELEAELAKLHVEPIVPRLRNNRHAHLDYLRHLKESVETIRNIVEEAKVVRPLGVNSFPNASGSQTKSHIKTNRISPAKGVNKLPVEDQPRTNKSHLRTSNRVNSSSRLRRTAINSNSDSVCQTCNKCLTSSNHDIVISMVYYVKGLGHNLFSVGQFCDSDLEVAFRKHSCYVRDTDGVELIKGSRVSNLYTISVEYMMKSSLICLLSKASKNKSWLWHRRLNHLNFGTIKDLARKDLVRGLPRLKFEKDHLCSAYSSRTPQQNGVVERRNRTLVEAARTMLIFSKALMFLWVEAVATACYTQNRSLIHTRHHKTPYELVHNKKPDLTFFRVFGALCYPINDSEDLGKLQPTADIGIFVGYAPSRKGYRIYNKRTRRIMETIHVQFDELTVQMAPVYLGTGLAPNFLTPGQISSGLPMFDEYLEPPRAKRPVPPAQAVQAPVNSAGTPSSTTIDQDTPSSSNSPSSSALQSHSLHQGVAAEPNHMKDHHVAPVDNNPFVN
nr:integrase, catalytic region, zinc finger, CCHC-type, peptidase aspartic, catalytic [Tanacetum cinerariifolium]